MDTTSCISFYSFPKLLQLRLFLLHIDKRDLYILYSMKKKYNLFHHSDIGGKLEDGLGNRKRIVENYKILFSHERSFG